MQITDEEKQILAQHYFEATIGGDWFDITGIRNFYELLYKSASDIENLGNYSVLRKFHVVHFDKLPPTTKIKLIAEAKMCFMLMGYRVEELEMK